MVILFVKSNAAARTAAQKTIPCISITRMADRFDITITIVRYNCIGKAVKGFIDMDCQLMNYFFEECGGSVDMILERAGLSERLEDYLETILFLEQTNKTE